MPRFALLPALTLLSFHLVAVEPLVDLDPDEAPEVTAERARQLARAMSTGSTTRGFRLRVVDQLERPIAGIPVVGSTTTLSSTFMGLGSPYNIVEAHYRSDAAGEVVIPPTKIHHFHAWVDRMSIPPSVAIPDHGQASFDFRSTDVRPPSAEAKRLGVDAVLHMYRYEGPRPLLAVYAPEREGLPANGTPFSWNPLQVKSTTAMPSSAFEVTVTRDPAAPLVIQGRLRPVDPEETLPNLEVAWTLRVRCLRGGIAPLTDQKMAFTAPEEGYRATSVWESTAQDQSYGQRKISFFWRRTGMPVRYVFVEMICDIDIKGVRTVPSVATTIRSWAYVNPAADDRLIERPFGERYDPRSRDTPPWITALSPELVEQWNLEPIDGGAIPLAP